MKLTFYTTGLLCAAIAALTFVEPASALHLNEEASLEIVADDQLAQNQLDVASMIKSEVMAKPDDNDDSSDDSDDKDGGSKNGADIKKQVKDVVFKAIDDKIAEDKKAKKVDELNNLAVSLIGCKLLEQPNQK